MSSKFSVVGTRQPRIDAFERVTGRARYTADVSLPGMLHLKVLRSPHPHARVVRIDASRALALPGVKLVLTHKDVPSYQWHPGMSILAAEARFAGDDIAVVAAVDADTAEEARDLIKVDYEVLPFILDPEEALKPGAPKVAPEGNLIGGKPYTVSRGDVERGFAEADLVYEARYRTPLLQHGYHEPRVSVAQWEAGKLTVWASSQATFSIQRGLARALKLPLSRIHVICEFVGGGFGDKTNAERHDILTAFVARKTGRPARLELDRDECYLAGHHRYPVISELKYGVRNDGTLTAIQAKITADMGAFPHSPGAANTMDIAMHVYRCPNMRGEAYSVLTNNPEAGAMRCVGHPQGTFAQEVHMDAIAARLGMDPVELRLKNYSRKEDGDQFRKLPFTSNGMRECIERGAESFGWQRRRQAAAAASDGPVKRGVGMAIHACRHGGMFPHAACSGMVRVNSDGTVNVFTGASDIGGGQKGTMAIIVAEELGVPLANVSVTAADTDATIDTGVTAGSRMTISGGNGARLAAADAKNQLLELAAEELKATPSELTLRGGMIYREGHSQGVPLAQITGQAANPIIGRGLAKPPTHEVFHTFAADFAEVEVDTRTGAVKVLQIVAAHDLGRAINPMTAENQIEGGIIQGLGFALSERQIVDTASGITLNPNHLDYKLPTIKDIPEITPLMIESVDPYGPFGAKGIGEPPYSPPSPAIANAIYHAVGVRLQQLPMTKRDILAALKAKG